MKILATIILTPCALIALIYLYRLYHWIGTLVLGKSTYEIETVWFAVICILTTVIAILYTIINKAESRK